MTETPTAAEEAWRARGRAEAPIARRAITRALLADRVPGHACAYAIVKAYGRDMTVLMPGVMNVRFSQPRGQLLTQLVSDANRTEWMEEFLSAPIDFMKLYFGGFLEVLDAEMANWAKMPTHPPENAAIVAEEEKWHLGLMMGDMLLPKPKAGWRKLLGR